MKNIAVLLAMVVVFCLLGYVISQDNKRTGNVKKFNSRDYLASTKNDNLIPEVKAKYGKMIRQICRQEKVHPALMSGIEIEKIIIIESSGNSSMKPDLAHPGDGIGLMGVKRSTASVQRVNPDSLSVPYWNLLAGIRHLNSMVALVGNVPGAIVAYNCGLRNYKNNYLAAGVSPIEATYYKKVDTLIKVERQIALTE